jgi:hypothetical protein
MDACPPVRFHPVRGQETVVHTDFIGVTLDGPSISHSRPLGKPVAKTADVKTGSGGVTPAEACAIPTEPIPSQTRVICYHILTCMIFKMLMTYSSMSRRL